MMAGLHPSSEKIVDILEDAIELHKKKAADYGSDTDPFANINAAAEAWGVPPWICVMIRIQDKLQRLQSLRSKGDLQNESAGDSLTDILVYSAIAQVLLEEDSD